MQCIGATEDRLAGARVHSRDIWWEREGAVGSAPGRGRGEGVKVPQQRSPPSAGLSASHLVAFLWELMATTMASQVVGGAGAKHSDTQFTLCPR